MGIPEQSPVFKAIEAGRIGTPRLNQLSKDLSFKIFDPVSKGDEDGKMFSAELRLGYINRAFGTLIRTLEIIHPKLLKVFKDYYTLLSVLVEGGQCELVDNYDIFDVYYAEEEGGDQFRASYIDPVNYMSTFIGMNKFREATLTSRYWTLINSHVMLLPVDEEYHNVVLVARSSFPVFAYNQGIEFGGRDINIPTDYMDILITMAAIEAMSDKGEQGKYTLYNNALTGKMQLIMELKKTQSIKEEGVS